LGLVLARRFLRQSGKEAGSSGIGKQGLPSVVINHFLQKERCQRFLLLLRLPLGKEKCLP